MNPGAIYQDEDGTYKVVESVGNEELGTETKVFSQTFKTVEEARVLAKSHKESLKSGQSLPDKLRQTLPSSFPFATLAREAIGGAKQLYGGIESNVGLLKEQIVDRPWFETSIPQMEKDFVRGVTAKKDIAQGGLRVLGAVPAELGTQAETVITAIGRQLGLSRNINKSIGTTANILASIISTGGQDAFMKRSVGFLKYIKDLERTMPFPWNWAKGLPTLGSFGQRYAKGEGKTGGAFRTRALEEARKRGQEVPKVRTLEEGIEFRRATGGAIQQAERKVTKEISDIIELNLKAIPTSAVRPASNTLKATKAAARILGIEVKEGVFPLGVGEISKRVRKRVSQPKQIRYKQRIKKRIDKYTVTHDVGYSIEDREISRILQGPKNMSIRALDEYRKSVGTAIGRLRGASNPDHRAISALGGVYKGLQKDMSQFGDVYPTQIKNLQSAWSRFSNEVVPLRSFEKLDPSQIVNKVFSSTPERITKIRNALPKRARENLSDGVVEGIILDSHNDITGHFEPEIFLQKLEPEKLAKLKELLPDRFADMMKLRSVLQKITPGILAMERKGGMVAAFGVGQVAKGVTTGSFVNIATGTAKMFAPKITARVASSVGGIKLMTELYGADPNKPLPLALTRKIFNAVNAAINSIERDSDTLEYRDKLSSILGETLRGKATPEDHIGLGAVGGPGAP
jgi:hypothetical protein